MAQRSNGYILGFATAVCVVCSVFVSSAALSLKDRQVANAELDLKKNVISVSGLKTASADGQLVVTPEDVDAFFNPESKDRVELGYVDLKSGKIADNSMVEKYRSENKGKCEELSSSDNIAKISCLPKYKEVFTVYKEGSVERIILNVEGKGLWSTLYGFLALSKDGATINGLTFYQHGETPGLGGEVDNPKWKKQWVGEQAYNKGEPHIDVVKGVAPSGVKTDGKLDGLSGATLTANGVESLLNFWLGEHGYGPYVKTLSKGS